LSEQSVAASLRASLLNDYRRARSQTEALASPITAEDAQVQSMDDVSPAKWHLGHTSWFFETFLLRSDADYRPRREEFKVIFNSYYNSVGEKHPRPKRGLLTRPALDEVLDYRHEVDGNIGRFLDRLTDDEVEEVAPVVRVGLNQQQHQELMMTDILHVYWSNPLRPAYCEQTPPRSDTAAEMDWHRYSEGLYRIGFDGGGFGFDNEYPRHRHFVHAFDLSSRLVTAGEFMGFIADGGYERPELWLSDAWAKVQRDRWRAPLYWERRQGTWWHMTLCGMQPVDPNAPVCHVSYYEADAYARWRGVRLPTEAEWEVAASEVAVEGNLQESDFLTPMSPPRSDDDATGPRQMYGDVWEWTQSAYLPYPGYRVSAGALGEYNGKFMCNQMVLRGGSFVTPGDHIRPTYRNFFYPDSRWQFMGIRLARDVTVR
jgi:ergothioneine biosynthesis protein EgtB